MERSAAGERFARILEARLEALAVVSERSVGGRDAQLEVLVTRAAEATRRAVELDLLSEPEAEKIWVGIRRRHPAVRWSDSGLAA
jgi:hypothetical protein